MVEEIKNLWVFDRNKILILAALYKCERDSNVCGCDLTELLDIPKNLLSYHIRILREKGFITEEKCGQKKNYRIALPRQAEIIKILQAVELAN